MKRKLIVMCCLSGVLSKADEISVKNIKVPTKPFIISNSLPYKKATFTISKKGDDNVNNVEHTLPGRESYHIYLKSGSYVVKAKVEGIDDIDVPEYVITEKQLAKARAAGDQIEIFLCYDSQNDTYRFSNVDSSEC